MQRTADPVVVVIAPPPVFVGVDVSKAKLDVYLEVGGDDNDDGRGAGGQWLHEPNDDAGVARLVERLRAASSSFDVRRVVIEATGRLHRRVASELVQAGIPVALVNPQRARAFARSQGKLEKTDRVDAKVLAGYGRCVRLRVLDEDVPPRQAELDDLVSWRRALVQMRVAEQNRLHEEPQLPKLAATQGRKMLRLIDQQLDDLDRAIAKLIDGDDDWRRRREVIASVPGVSDGTANQLIADLPELGRLGRQRIAKLVGVAPLADDSGPRKGARHIRGGRRPVRNALYMAAFNAIRFCDRFRRMAERMRQRGKAFKVIVTACMRKLLVTLNQMVKTDTVYDASINASVR